MRLWIGFGGGLDFGGKLDLAAVSSESLFISSFFLAYNCIFAFLVKFAHLMNEMLTC